MVNQTSPRARQNFATASSSRFLNEAEARARELIGKTRRTASSAASGAAAANTAATDAQDAADAAQVAADSKLPPAVVTAIATDADETFTPGTLNSLVRHSGTLTALRSLALGTAPEGSQIRVVRTGIDAFLLDVDGLKSLPTASWCDLYSIGASWILTAYGTL
jgi:hypothetical protein